MMRNSCRTCGTILDTHNAFDILSHTTLMQQLELITGLRTFNRLDLPQFICDICVTSLQQAIGFRETCIETYRKYIHQLKVASRKTELDAPKNDEHEEYEIKDENSLIKLDPYESIDFDCYYTEIDVKNDGDPLVGENINTIDSDVESDNAVEYESKKPVVVGADEVVSKFDEMAQEIIKPEKKEKVRLASKSKRGKHFRLKRGLDPVQLQQTNVKNTQKSAQIEEPIQPITELAAAEMCGDKRGKLKQKRILKKNMVCDQCSKRFAGRRELEAHLLKHAGVKDVECEYCDAKFATKHLLKLHVRIHTNPFKCSFCDEIFGYKNSKKRHERLHTNERPFKCGYCDQRFICSTSMRDHEVYHKGERTLHCKICERSFFTKRQLWQHMGTQLHKAEEEALKQKKTKKNCT